MADRKIGFIGAGQMARAMARGFVAAGRIDARAVGASDAVSVVGGGDSVAAINKLDLGSQITHLSTGGGASLEYIQGLELPGVAALDR